MTSPPADRSAFTDAGETRSAAERLREARARLAQLGPAPGRDWCRAWADAVDGAVIAQAGRVLPTRGVTLLAVGGYGRRELAPGSDVDLLVLHDDAEEDELAAIVRAVTHPLWDAGLTVGHAVRDRWEALEAAAELTDATALLDARVLAGDEGLAEQVRLQTGRRLRRRPETLLRALTEADRERRAAHSSGALEPDLKDGAGGLRDLQSLRWAAAALVGRPTLDGLVAGGYVAAADRARLAAAEETLLTARVALHLTGGSDALRRDRHDAVAARCLDGAGGSADARDWLTGVMLALRAIHHAHRRAWALIEADLAHGRRRRARPALPRGEGLELGDGVLRLAGEADLDDPGLVHRLLAELVATGAALDRRSAATLRRAARRPGRWGWPRGHARRTLDALWAGEIVLPAIDELDDAGVLTALLPGWQRMRGRPQRNPYHRFTLDAHSWHAVAELGELVRREPWAARALAEAGDPDVVLVAALAHDLGKAIGEPHERTGAPAARRLAAHVGLSDDAARRVGLLTRHHLLLAATARHRDVDDPAVVREVAALVGDRPTLAALHLLTVADGRATGPGAWSGWSAELVARLVDSVRLVLGGTAAPTALLASRGSAATTASRARELAGHQGRAGRAVQRLLDDLPARYPASVPVRDVLAHARLLDRVAANGRARSRHVAGETGGRDGARPDRLDVVALDRVGWLADVLGRLAMARAEVDGVDAFPDDRGLALTLVRLRAPGDADDGWWPRLHEAIRAVDERRQGLDAGLQRLVARARRRRGPAPVTVAVSAATPAGARRLAVTGASTTAELSLVARTVADAGLDVGWARLSGGPGGAQTLLVAAPGADAIDEAAAAALADATREALGAGPAAGPLGAARASVG